MPQLRFPACAISVIRAIRAIGVTAARLPRRALSSVSALLAGSLLALASPAQADTVQVLSSGAYKPVLLAVAPVFEARTGHTVVVSSDTADAVARRAGDGEVFDLLVLPPPALRFLAGQGRLAADDARPLGRVAIGVAVPAGHAPVAVGTEAQFRQALLNARRVAVMDPSAGAGGRYLDGLFERMGIAAQVRAKAVLVRGGFVAEQLVTGEADLAVHDISEMLPVTGIDMVGPIPEKLQHYTVYAGALSRNARHAEAARLLLDLLAGETGRAALPAKGLYVVD